MPTSGTYDQEARWNPILRKFVPVHVTAEPHVVGPIDGLPGVYGIKLIEIPLKPEDESTVTVPNPPIVIPGYVMTSGTPGAGEFRADFYEDSGAVPYRSSLIIFDVSANTDAVTVDYYAGGGAGIISNMIEIIRNAIVSSSSSPLVSVKLNREVITTPGAGTWNKPANILPGSSVNVRLRAGGAGGGATGTQATNRGGGGGGAAGGESEKSIPEEDLGSSEAYTVGAAGVGGAAGNNNGTAGGDTEFGTHLSATGGSPGTYGASGTPGFGGASGIGADGDLNQGLGDGFHGTRSDDNGSFVTSTEVGGSGGGPGGGRGGYSTGGSSFYDGHDATGYGCGGGGAGNASSVGGDGMGGYIIVEFWTIEEAA